MAGPGMQGYGNGQRGYFPSPSSILANSFPRHANCLMLHQPQRFPQRALHVPLVRPVNLHTLPPATHDSCFMSSSADPKTCFPSGPYKKVLPAAQDTFDSYLRQSEYHEGMKQMNYYPLLSAHSEAGKKQNEIENAAIGKGDLQKPHISQNQRPKIATGVRDGTGVVAEPMNRVENLGQTSALRGSPSRFEVRSPLDSVQSELNPRVKEFKPSNFVQEDQIQSMAAVFDREKTPMLNALSSIQKNSRIHRDAESQTIIEGVEFDKGFCDGCKMKLNNCKESASSPALSHTKKLSIKHKAKYLSIQASVLVTESPALLDRLGELKTKLKSKLQNTCKLFEITPTDMTETEDEALCVAAIILLKEEVELALPSNRERFLRKLIEESKNHMEIAQNLMSVTFQDSGPTQIFQTQAPVNKIALEEVPATHIKSTALSLNSHSSLQPQSVSTVPLNIPTSVPETVTYNQSSEVGGGDGLKEEAIPLYQKTGFSLQKEKELEELINYQNQLMQQLLLIKSSGHLQTSNPILSTPGPALYPGLIPRQPTASTTNLLKSFHNFSDPNQVWKSGNGDNKNQKESFNRNPEVYQPSTNFGIAAAGGSMSNITLSTHPGNSKSETQRDVKYEEMTGVCKDLPNSSIVKSTVGRGKKNLPPLDLRPSKLHNKRGPGKVQETTAKETEAKTEPDNSFNLSNMLSNVTLSSTAKPAQNTTDIFSHSAFLNASNVQTSRNFSLRESSDCPKASFLRSENEIQTDSLSGHTQGISRPPSNTEVPKSRKLLTPLQRKRLKMNLQGNVSSKPSFKPSDHHPPEIDERNNYSTTIITPWIAAHQVQSTFSQTSESNSALQSNPFTPQYNTSGALPLSTSTSFVMASSFPLSHLNSVNQSKSETLSTLTSKTPIQSATHRTNWMASYGDIDEVSENSFPESASLESMSDDREPGVRDKDLISARLATSSQSQSTVHESRGFTYTKTWHDTNIRFLPKSTEIPPVDNLQSERICELSENNYESTHIQRDEEPKMLSYKDCLVTNMKPSEESQHLMTDVLNQGEICEAAKFVSRMPEKVKKFGMSGGKRSQAWLENNRQVDIQVENDEIDDLVDNGDKMSEMSHKKDRNIEAGAKHLKQEEALMKTRSSDDVHSVNNKKYGLDDFSLMMESKKARGSTKKAKETKARQHPADLNEDSDVSSNEDQVQEEDSKDGSRYPDVIDATEVGWQTVTKQNKSFKKQQETKLAEFRSQEKYTNLTSVILEIHKFLKRREAQSVLETVFISTNGMAGMRQPQILKQVKLVVEEEFPSQAVSARKICDTESKTETFERKNEDAVKKSVKNKIYDFGRTGQPIDKDCEVQ